MNDSEVPAFWQALGLPGLADVHVHFLPPRMLRRVWAYFDAAGPLVGVEWPIRYRWPDADRVAHLDKLGVRAFTALAYAHKPGMAADLNDWTLGFARETPGCVPSATFYPEPSVTSYVSSAVSSGARVFKVHLQVGGFDPVDPLLAPCGACSPTPGSRWSYTPGTRRWPPRSPGPNRSPRCWRGTRGSPRSWPTWARPTTRRSSTWPRGTNG
ncbi:hypothetical protein Prum_066570 [Phytohabitans rumicis]|uniref:Amidohydrolase-related domain-containing protein n=1 Tax=Phytohabitans rumicis TaxID=1076125 RepID=A0A6V8LK69_9ACTN|nr:hypothetical protein Prum_066570 [Phytohabitans rumicis]